MFSVPDPAPLPSYNTHPLSAAMQLAGVVTDVNGVAASRGQGHTDAAWGGEALEDVVLLRCGGAAHTSQSCCQDYNRG